jgi:allantoate deiminase
MHDVHRYLSDWMRALRMDVRLDAVGNIRGLYAGEHDDGPRLLVGSHLDTVPNAGAYDGVLGVVLGLALIEDLRGRRLPFAIEVVGFSEEEGVRFGVPFLGSRALVGRVDAETLQLRDSNGVSVEKTIRQFGLNPDDVASALLDPRTFAYVEFHVEQGPVLDYSDHPFGIVHAIAGQSRYSVTFQGRANHAGTTPMDLRSDALAAAAQWISAVETRARRTDGLVATVAAIESEPRAGNVIPGRVTASLDVRHAEDQVRLRAVIELLEKAREIASARRVLFHAHSRLEQSAVSVDPTLIDALERAAVQAGYQPPRMVSGAGHDAMIIAEKIPSAMLFIRSPHGISHHPDEAVREEDVDAAIAVGRCLLRELAAGNL